MLKYIKHKIDKKIINNFIKYYTYCQKHEKSSNWFKFILEKNHNFNDFILIHIIYLDGSLILYIINKITRLQVAR